MTRLELRNKLAEEYAVKVPHYSAHSFKEGWDACEREMQKELDELNRRLEHADSVEASLPLPILENS
jgi:hypothetical protein